VNDLQSNQKKSTSSGNGCFPQSFAQAFEALPVVFLPLGTVEWHGEHNALGLDSLKAHALCVNAARWLAEAWCIRRFTAAWADWTNRRLLL
jgi:hypothetical protein